MRRRASSPNMFVVANPHIRAATAIQPIALDTGSKASKSTCGPASGGTTSTWACSKGPNEALPLD